MNAPPRNPALPTVESCREAWALDKITDPDEGWSGVVVPESWSSTRRDLSW